MADSLSKIITNVLVALYQPFWFAILMSILMMISMEYVKEHDGVKETVKNFVKKFKEVRNFRTTFYFVFYVVMILFRTLLNRNMWANPVSNVIGIWGFYNANGEFTTECVENVILFIPFTFLYLWKTQADAGIKTGRLLCKSVWVSFLFSLGIETIQLFMRLGTWQLSDLLFNTLGGFLGGLIFLISRFISLKKHGEI